MEDKPWKNPNDNVCCISESILACVENKKLLKTYEDDFSGNILPDPKPGGAGGGLKGLLSRNLMKLAVKCAII